MDRSCGPAPGQARPPSGFTADPLRLVAEERLDLVDIATHMGTHLEFVTAAVARGTDHLRTYAVARATYQAAESGRAEALPTG